MIYLLENIFPDNVRKELIKESIPLLLSRKEMAKKGSIYESNKRKNFPGSQTLSNLHTLPQFKEVIDSLTYLISKTVKMDDLVVDRVWVSKTNGRKSDMKWHRHARTWTIVYYMKTFLLFSNGTLFRDGLYKAPQNSLIIFPSHLEHTAPPSPLPFDRYTLAGDWRK